ncbi:MAG: hypothetical protein ACJ8GN_13260 [Longimicrobiaceae bacterium]
MDDDRSHDEKDSLSPAVTRRAQRLWPAEGGRRRVREALARYGVEAYEQEPERVRLAILKLAGGDVDQVISLVAAAKRDFRDVLLWAEYPEEARASWARGSNLTQAESDRLEALRRRDRQQYEDWLKAGE